MLWSIESNLLRDRSSKTQ